MTKDTERSRSTELTGGEGFTFEDTVVAHYLTALLHEDAAAGLTGRVVRVAVQQAGAGEPLDDLIVDAELDGSLRRLSLQVKRQLKISTAASNADFREVIANSLKTRAKTDFRVGQDRYGAIARTIADDRLNSLERIVKRARAGADFVGRFRRGGEASQADILLRGELLQLIQPADADTEADFYRHFFVKRMDGLDPQGDRYAEMANRLGQLAATGPQEGSVLAEVLCRHVRSWEGTARVWTRSSLLAELKELIRLGVAPSYARDVGILTELARAYVADIRADIGGVTIDRTALVNKSEQTVRSSKLSNISGLPGCGKSVILRRLVERALEAGPVLFLKSDRLEGSSWRSFATSAGLQHRSPIEILAEIGATGAPTLFIDGIDRIKSEHRGIVTDLLHAIEVDSSLAHWRVVASSRDQGLEVFRSWIPASFYRQTGIGNVAVEHLNDAEAERLATERPHLRPLLFGVPNVREIARRPFFAAVLSDQLLADGIDATAPPQTENELIAAWWRRGGYDVAPETALERQRAILDFAEAGAQSLGKSISARGLQSSTISQTAALRQDRIIAPVEEGSVFSFAHDIFFEWAFFRLLIDRSTSWPETLTAAGEPPLLARIVSLLSQHVFEKGGDWSGAFRRLQAPEFRPQWRRAWLLGPPASPKFIAHLSGFESLLNADNFALLQKFLVWFQAERTIPSPILLNNPNLVLEGAALVRAADKWGWPSDTAAWRRVLSWILHRQSTFPTTAIPLSVELFAVWQNMAGDFANPTSASVVSTAEQWLIELEKPQSNVDGQPAQPTRWAALSRDAQDRLRSALRQLIFRSGRDPDPARRALDRIIAFERRSQDLFELVLAFSLILAEICPDRLAELVRVEVIKELPKDKIEKKRRRREEHNRRLAEIRAKPEEQRSDMEKRALANVRCFGGADRYDFHNIGIDYHHGSYYPPTPLHQPFASLFQSAPSVARALVRDLANRAATGWRQVCEINAREYGTPLPLDLEFPWGRQRFWGDMQTYEWFLGRDAPQPLEAGFLALTYWAHKSLDAGRDVDGLIQEVVEGHESWTVLGLACSLALQGHRATEVVLPLATAQRLWDADARRQGQDSNRDITLFGFNPRDQITREQRDAFDYLKGRQFRSESIRELTYAFALSSDEGLRSKFKLALQSFPEDLPYNYEEEKANEAYTERLLETAKIWAKWGDTENSEIENVPDQPGMRLVSYRDPEPMREGLERRREASARSLGDFNVVSWVNASFEKRAPDPRWKLESVVEFARSRDSDDLLLVADKTGAATQPCIAAAAAAAIQFATDPVDTAWGWTVMDRVVAMKENEGPFEHSPNPMDPRLYLIGVLVHDLRGSSPRSESANRLITLASDENPNISKAALVGSLRLHDASPILSWTAAALASELFATHVPVYRDNMRDGSAQKKHQLEARQRALQALANGVDSALAPPPPAWVLASVHRERRRFAAPDDESWEHPDFDFNPAFTETVIGAFPVEFWCQSVHHREAFLTYMDELVCWTANRLFPDWADEEERRQHSTMPEWFTALSGLISRVLPFVAAGEVINRSIDSLRRSVDKHTRTG